MSYWQDLFMFQPVAPVGSRVTCNPAPTDTDADYLVLAEGKHSEALRSMGFRLEGGPEFYTGNDDGEFRSWRRGEINLIITPHREFYDRFLAATSLAKRFNLMRKVDRIALFQAVLYGVKAENLRA